MGSKTSAYIIIVLSFYALGGADLYAQRTEASPFLRSLSFEWYGQSISGNYNGYAGGGRFAIASVKTPMLNRLFTSDADAWGDLMVLPGMKVGSAHEKMYAYDNAVQIIAPDVALHYPLLNISPFGVYAGPALELTYTNNARKYLAIPSVGIDLGLTLAVTENVSASIEQRWIVTKATQVLSNAANFPSRQYAYIGVGLRFALPWQAEEKAYERTSDVTEKYERTVSLLDAVNVELGRKVHENDSLAAENAAMQVAIEKLSVRPAPVPVQKPDALDSFDPAVKADDPEYLFTRDPFKSGNLVNDAYLKNVLIDIIDDSYVWQISAKGSRRADAEKIRNFFAFYNSALGRRIVIAPDDNVKTFKLTCLGKVTGIGSGTKRK